MDKTVIIPEELLDVQDLLNAKLPLPEMLEYYRLLRNREIVWNDDITDYIMEIPLYIIKWNREDEAIPTNERKPIKIWINSDGGETNITLFTANVISLSKTPVITIAMGRAYSSGGLLLMAGHKRLIFDSTSVLIHDGSSGAIGDTGKVIDNLEFTKQLEERVRQFILNHTSIPEDVLEKNYRRDWFLFSDDVIKFGIADKIITDISEVL